MNHHLKAEETMGKIIQIILEKYQLQLMTGTHMIKYDYNKIGRVVRNHGYPWYVRT